MFRRNNRTFPQHHVCLAVLTALAFALTGCGNDDEHEGHDHSKHSAAPASGKIADMTTDDYPLTTCVVAGQPLDVAGDPHIIQHEGREIRFCCKDCETTFKKEPGKYLAILDKAAGERKSAQERDSQAAHDHEHGDHAH
jgi:YHS domain-containing protein